MNGGPAELDGLRGTPVLVHFFSLSSGEAVQQLARVRAWCDRYGGALQFVGVHSPLEVSDMDHEGVAGAVRELGLRHPVALDGDDGALADGYDVRASPAYFLFDAQLRLRNQRSGAGAAEAMERILARVFPRVSELENSNGA